MLSFSPLNPIRDIRNASIGFADDLYYFASYHPFWSLCSGGTLTLAYGVYTWGRNVITYVTVQLSELIGLSNRYATTILETAHPPTTRPLSSWNFNPLQWMPTTWSPRYHFALWKTPSFQGYEIKLPDGHPCKGAGLLSTSVRPVNLLSQEIFRDTKIALIPPSPRNLFSYLVGPSPFTFNRPATQVAQFIKESAAFSPHEVISISAKDVQGKMNGVAIADLREIFGSNTYELSRQEILNIASSLTIHASRFLPLPFYTALEEALLNDGIVELPSIDLRDVRSLHTQLLLRRVKRDPLLYGFQGKDHFEKFCQLSLAQIGALVVKTEHFYPLVDGDGKILSRTVKCASQCVDIESLRQFHRHTLSHSSRRQIAQFYTTLESFLIEDGLAELPPIEGHDDLALHTSRFLKTVERSPSSYGFQGLIHFQQFRKLSLDQIRQLVLHTYPEDSSHDKPLINQGHLPDAIQLVNMCGLKDSHLRAISDDCQQMILRAAFKTALIACEQGMTLFPAVGLADGTGNPDLYWRAFLDAVKDTPTHLDWIGVNPEHSPTLYGIYKGSTGQEFQTILSEYIKEAKATKNSSAIANLGKISNLYSQRKDLLQLARELKKVYPRTRLSLINGSNPDALLGNRIGAQVNQITRQCTDSEANYTALGTKFLASKTLSRQFPSRCIQC